ncbi:MAG: OmpA family protein [Paludibacteraceae bacterium]|nr:OmpA family protein [Paludibacteraceae bacterium]
MRTNKSLVKASLIVVMLLFALPVMALKYPCQKELKKGQFELAKKKIEQLLEKTPKDCKANYAAYLLYTDSLWDGYNPELGYEYLVKSQAGVSKDRAKLIKEGFTKDQYTKDYLRVGEMIWANYKKINTVEAYEQFINKYKKLPSRLKNRAYKVLYEPEYMAAVAQNTEEAYRQYLHQYPKSPYIKMVEARIKLLDAYGDWTKYRDVIENASDDDEDVIEFALVEMYQILRQTESVEGLKFACRIKSPVRDSCIFLLHKLYTETDNIKQIQQFYWAVPRILDSEMYNALKSKDEQMFAAFDRCKNNRTQENMEQLVCAAAPYYFAYNVLTILLEEDIAEKRWAEALEETLKFDSCFAGEHRYEELKELLSRQTDPTIVPQALPATINSDASEYIPQLSGDGNTMLFCGMSRLDSVGGEDIYEAKRINGVWQPAKIVQELCSENMNEAPVSISVDGNSLIMFRSGNLCVSHKTEEGWSEPQPLPANINFTSWQADARITSDGRALLFAARCITEREVHLSSSYPSKSELFHEINIFVSLLREDGTWGAPMELGKTINTPFCDRAPFLHPDMKTLYFCSDGHGGFGGLDVYRCQRLNEDSWTEWSEPVNLGKEINTVNNNNWYVISTDGQTAYYANWSDATGQDIYQLPLPLQLQPDKVATVSGVLTDKAGKPLDAEIVWEDLVTHHEVGRSRSNPIDGTFFIVLPKGKIYGYYVDKEGFFPIAENIDLRDVENMVEMTQDITVVTYEQMIEEEIPMPLNNLFFPTAQAVLLPESQSELRRMAKIIIELGAKVEISGHTDNVGNKTANQLLSEQRAKAAYDFLVAEGCNPELLQWRGYGATKPIADNRTENGRQQNRRVELRFVK